MPLSSTQPPIDHIRGFRDAAAGKLITYTALKELTTYVSNALAWRYHLRGGQTACLIGTNSVWYPVALFSAVRLGSVVSAASPASTEEELLHNLKTSKAKLIFTSKDCLPVALEAAQAIGLSKQNIVLFDGRILGYYNVTDLVEMGKEIDPVLPYAFPCGEDGHSVCSLLTFSSGTTGLSKAIKRSHSNMIAQCLQCRQVCLPEADCGTCLGVLPFFHIAGLSQLVFLPFFLNQEVVVLPKFEMRTMLEAIKQYQISELWLVPPLSIRLIMDPLVAEYDLSTLRQIIVGAAPLSLETSPAELPGLVRDVRRSHSGAAGGLQDFEHAHTVGLPLSGSTLKIVDPETGLELESNHSGEICLKGPSVCMGYLDNEKANKELFDEEGWIHTGDLGSVDEAGSISIQDRIKELIKVKGFGVAPAEIEDLLLGHPHDEDVAVIGVPDFYAGERPKAFVVLRNKDGANQETTEDLFQYVRDKKSSHKWLDGGVAFVDAIPKSTSGKMLRRILKLKSWRLARSFHRSSRIEKGFYESCKILVSLLVVLEG